MAFKTRRQHRYEFLRDRGFLKFEARELSKVSLKVPYFDILIQERYKLFVNALQEGWSKKQYIKKIKDEYETMNWIEKTPQGNIASKSAWNMFRANEDAHKQKYPTYESPWEKRKRSFRDFVDKTEDVIKKHYKDWIEQLDKSIANARTKADRERLQQQKANLQTWVKD